MIKKVLTILGTLLFSFFLLLPLEGTFAQIKGGSSSSKFCNDLKSSTSGIVKCSSDAEGVSFTEFNGEFKPPSAEGYDPALTKSRTLREFVLTIVRFVLGFLGLGAVVVVIYGGVMYVASGGNEEQANKGKNAIKYAVIGIIIILGSFAIVNTLLMAGTGSDKGAEIQGGQVAGDIYGESAEKKLFYQETAKKINEIAANIVTEYEKYLSAYESIETLKRIPLKGNAENGAYTLDQVKRSLEEVEAKVGSLSSTRFIIDHFLSHEFPTMVEAAKEGELEKWNTEEKGVFENMGQFFKDAWEDVRYFFENGGKNRPKSFPFEVTISTYTQAVSFSNDLDFKNYVMDREDELRGLMEKITGMQKTGTATSDGKKSINPEDLKKGIGQENKIEPIAEKIDKNYFNIASCLQDIRYLGRKDGVNKYFGKISKVCAGDKCNSESTPEENLTCRLNNEGIVKLIKYLEQLSNQIASTEFVDAKINASTLSGSAPLFINFDGLKTVDPNNKTIPDTNYVWNLLGTNIDDKSSCEIINGKKDDNCVYATGPSLSARFNKVGRYKVALYVRSSDPEKIADGKSMIDIIVEPRAADIVLSAGMKNSSPSEFVDISNVSVYQIDKAMGKAGVVFEASKSKGKGGMDLKKFTWKFGDGSPEIVQTKQEEKAGQSSPQTNLEIGKVTHIYGLEGRYELELEVEDQAGNKDRLIITIVISSPTARINLNTLENKVGDDFNLDGGASTTDEGKIVSYKWKILKVKASPCDSEGEVSLVKNDTPQTTFTPQKPGQYDLMLTVLDSLGRENTISRRVYVSSRSPKADLKVSQLSKYKPNIYLLDASMSMDPDKEDKLFYAYSGEGFQKVEAINEAEKNNKNLVDNSKIWEAKTSCDLSQYGSSDPKIEVKFNKTGTYKIILRVTDEHGKFDVLEKEINVTSVLDVDFESINPNKNKFAKMLNQEGKAVFQLKAISEKAVEYSWDFGDKFATDELGNIASGQEVEHAYQRASAYRVTLKVKAEDGSQNEISKKVYVGNLGSAIADIRVYVNNKEIPDEAAEIVVSRNDVITLDATYSVAPDGGSDAANLSFTWDLGRGQNDLVKEPLVKIKYEEITTDKPYEVTLKVVPKIIPAFTDMEKQADSEKTKILSEKALKIKVIPMPPKISSMEIEPLSTKLLTPLEIKLKAIGAMDPDGKIVTYKWWYHHKDNTSKKIDTQISIEPETTMIVNTYGDEGAKNTYVFGVELTDNEGNSTIYGGPLPAIEVENGPNKAPKSSFSVNKTNVLVGETINFVSTSKDEDGIIANFIWDFEGNGFYDNEKQRKNADPTMDRANVAYTFTKVSKEGIPVRLKVVDNNGSTAVSDPVMVYIDSIAKPPEAAFSYEIVSGKKVKFTNNSRADERTGQIIKNVVWDFNLIEDSDGNGNPDDDNDKANQKHDETGMKEYIQEYPDFGIYRVKLTVTDGEGNLDQVVRFVKVEGEDEKNLEAAFTYTVKENNTVEFINNSRYLDGSILQVKKVSWDFDLNSDADGNGVPDDDDETANKNHDAVNKKVFVHQYAKAGSYQIKMTVQDIDTEDSVTRNVVTSELSQGGSQQTSSNLDARLIANPMPQIADGKIHLSGDKGTISFDYKTSRGEITKYIFDKNILYDTNGNGTPDDDEDHFANSQEVVQGRKGVFNTNFEKSWGRIIVRLTIYDEKGNKDFVEKEVVFDPTKISQNLSQEPKSSLASVFQASALMDGVLGSESYTVLALSSGFAILLAGSFLALHKKSKKNKK